MMVRPLPIGVSVYHPNVVISHCGLNLQSFLANDFEHHFMCLYAICISSSVIGLFNFLVHFLIELFLVLFVVGCFLLLTFWSSPKSQISQILVLCWTANICKLACKYFLLFYLLYFHFLIYIYI